MAAPKSKPVPEAAPEAPTQQTAQQKLDKFLDDQAKELTIDEVNLSSEFGLQARKFLMAASRHNKAIHVLAMVKMEVESIEADSRNEIVAGKEKKPTEGEIAGQMALDGTVQAARKKLAYATMQASQYHSVVRAWEHKRDMLVQMGSTQRAEMHAGVSMSDPKNPQASGAPLKRAKNPEFKDDYFET